MNDRSEKSLIVAIEQISQLLRAQTKGPSDKARKTERLSSLHPSFKNTVEQMAVLLRSQIRSAKSTKKRSIKIVQSAD